LEKRHRYDLENKESHPMRELLIGIDSGTQSTKTLVMDADRGRVLGFGLVKYGFIPNLPPGAKEQHPATWRKAALGAMKAASCLAFGLAAC
jgi:sugar (pentulose or hexulose) kinase